MYKLIWFQYHFKKTCGHVGGGGFDFGQ